MLTQHAKVEKIFSKYSRLILRSEMETLDHKLKKRSTGYFLRNYSLTSYGASKVGLPRSFVHIYSS